MNLLSRGLAALSLLACASVVTRAQTPAGPLPMPRLQFFDASGRPLSGGKVYTYSAGTSTPLATYTDASGTVSNSNPVILDAGGFASIWVKTGVYKVVVQNSAGVQQWTADNVSNPGQTAAVNAGVANGYGTLDGSARQPLAQMPLYNNGLSGAQNTTFTQKGQQTVSASEFAGADIGAQVNAAIAALATTGGRILIPRGTYTFSTPIAADNSINITIEGAGGETAGAPAATKLLYTGTATVVSAHQTQAFILRDLQLVASNAAFAADFVDYSHGTYTFDSAFGLIERCSFYGTNGAMAAVAIELNKAILTTVRDSTIQNAVIGVRGLIAASGDYSNVITVQNVHFSSSTGSISQAHISNPGQSWLMLANTHEMGTAAGVAKAIACNVTSSANSIAVIGAWIGDWTSGTTGATDIEVCGGGAWALIANEIAGPFTGTITGVSVKDNVLGVVSAGNRFDVTPTGATIYSFGSNVKDFSSIGNMIPGGATLMAGAPVGGLMTSTTGATVLGTLIATLGASALTGQLHPTTSTGLPDTIGLDGQYLMGGFASPDTARVYIGNGTGFQLGLYKRNATVDTKVGYIQDNGSLNMAVGYSTNGAAGLSVTKTVKGSDGNNCTNTYAGGILTATTCP